MINVIDTSKITVYGDTLTNNVYLLGEIGDKLYLYNAIMRFPINKERLKRLTKINLRKKDIKDLLANIEKYSGSNFENIEFQKETIQHE